MFKRSASTRGRIAKIQKKSTRSFRDDAKQKLRQQLNTPLTPPTVAGSPRMNSAIVTVLVGQDQRLFAAHEDILCRSPFFAATCKDPYFQANGRRIALLDEEPEIFSAILEFLYKGDYYPRLLHDRKRNTWVLEDGQETFSPRDNSGHGDGVPATIYSARAGCHVLRDTVMYCAAERYGLEDLKRLALRKQGLHHGIDVPTLLRSARFAYDNTPDTDSRLRAHYLALIIRSRKIFKRSGTMQLEMESGGRLFFDLFVAMCNHIEDVTAIGNQSTPKTI